MRTLDSTFKSEKNKSADKPIYLYTIYDYDGSSNNLYFAEWDTDIVYNGITYTRFPITHDFIGENSQNEVDSVKVSIGNVSREIQAYLELYDLRGVKVDITLVWADQLADTDAYITDTFYIDSYTADEQAVTFTLTSKFDVIDLTLPVRNYSRNYCSWKFKSTECGYAGATATCNKTKVACKAMAGGSNYARFGGFPSVPSQRVAIG